jgi:hypothetical protein
MERLAHGGKQRKMTLAATEFLRRFFLHVLPKALFGFATLDVSQTDFAHRTSPSADSCWRCVRRNRQCRYALAKALQLGIARTAARLWL